MGYKGQAFQIPCNRGGFNNNQNTDLIPPEMFVSPSRNINLHEGGRHKRGGTAKVNGTAVSGAPRIMGGIDFKLASTSYQVFLANDGKLYSSPTTTLKTGLSTANFPSFAIFNNELYEADGAHRPQTWDGAAGSTSDLTTPAADWTGGDQPFQVIVHGKGASRRTWWLLGNKAYYSVLANGKDCASATSGVITIDTGDAVGLVGGVDFQGRLILFSRDQAFLITDDDPDTATWGYETVAWAGGAAHWRTIVKTTNDLIIMDESGEIYSITSVQAFGDYKRASLARPAFVDNYIRDNVDLTRVANFHAVYDPVIRAVFFWVTRNGQTTNDTALVYFIDRPPEEGWTIHDNQNYNSGYSASCAFVVRVSAGTYTIYTGDYSGFLWKLNQTTRSDDSNAYYGGFKTPALTFDNPRVTKHYKRGFVVAKTQGSYDLQINVWIDGQVQAGATVSLAGTGGVLGSFILGTDVLGGTEFLAREFELGYRGRRIQLEFYNNTAAQDFFVSQILIDHKMGGALPQ